jgi:BTB/POZ domain
VTRIVNEVVSGRISAGMATLLAGQTGKPFVVHTDLLTSRSPYFQALLGDSNANANNKIVQRQQTIAYPDLDEFAFALFVRWLYGALLTGPTDFHSMHHYIGLYILAHRFRIERLQNSVIDLVRFYYRSANMTAPPYRLDYIYEQTSAPNNMRTFLVSTAAYRVLCEGTVSEAMKSVVRKGGDLAIDFAELLVKLHADGLTDARRGSDCTWHVHEETSACKKKRAEAYEAD